MEAIITPEQIITECNNKKCKYVTLYLGNDKTRAVLNHPTSTSLQQQVDEILDYLKKNPQDKFFTLCCFNSRKPNQIKHYFTLTNTPTGTMSTPAIYNYNTPFDNDRITTRELATGNEIAQLKADLKLMEFQLAEAKLKIGQYEAEDLADEETIAEETPSKLQGFLKDILPQFLPLADRYFELADKKLALQVMQMNKTQMSEHNANCRCEKCVKKIVHPFRPLPDVNDRAKIDRYMNWLEKVPEHIFNSEVKFCEQNAPGLAELIKNNFLENTQNEKE
jgi:uncharacterized protein YlbG (UPF0298 family)